MPLLSDFAFLAKLRPRGSETETDFSAGALLPAASVNFSFGLCLPIPPA